MPGAIRRKTLRIASCSKITLVLLCSDSNTRGAASVGRVAPGSLANVTSPRTADESINDNRNWAASAS